MAGRIPLPERFEVGANNSERWHIFRQRWNNYVVVADFRQADGENAAALEAKKKCHLLH